MAFDKVDTLLNNNIKIEGTVFTKGTIKLNCEVIGKVRADGNIIIEESGIINGSIESTNAIISGNIIANVLCSNKIHITNTGHLIGEIEAKRVVIDEKAIFKGSCIIKN